MENRTVQHDNSRKTLAIVLIVVGILLLLKKSGLLLQFPFVHFNVFHPLQEAFSGIRHLIFSWPVILLIVGVILLAGRRSGGWVLIIIGGLFLLPKLIFLSGAAFVFLLPLILIGAGIAIVARLL